MVAVTAILIVIGAYVLGSLPTGVLVGRTRGVDVTKVGSGNIGATNVARALGWWAGLFVLAIDTAKGFAPVAALRGAGFSPHLVACVGLAAVIGHIFPVWRGGRGGKGVATTGGVFLALTPGPALVCAALYGATVAACRISSVGSLVATTALPLLLLLQPAPKPFVVAAVVSWLLVAFRHRDNLVRLWRRDEHHL